MAVAVDEKKSASRLPHSPKRRSVSFILSTAFSYRDLAPCCSVTAIIFSLHTRSDVPLPLTMHDFESGVNRSQIRVLHRASIASLDLDRGAYLFPAVPAFSSCECSMRHRRRRGP